MNDYSHSPLTPVAFLDRTAHVFPDQTAVVDGERRYTWAAVRERVRQLAVALQASGIDRGDRVAFLAPNSHELLEAHFGVPAAGAVLVAIDPRLMAEEISYILEHSGARIVVVDESLCHLVDEAAVERVLVCGEGGDYDPFLATAREGEPEDRLESESDMISINYTSGSTGRPKGVIYTHRGAALNALAQVVHTGLESRSSFLWTLPMFHCNGWCFTWAVTAAAAKHVCLPRVEPELVWQLIEEERVTHLNGAPTVLAMLNSAAAVRQLERPVLVTTAAAPPPPVLERIEGLAFDLHHVYGLTETYGPITLCQWHPAWDGLSAHERARMKARQGVPYAAADPVRVVDEWMRDVPPDGVSMGEIVMRGDNVTPGYFRDQQATLEAFRGGWFHSGDVGVMYQDGYIEVRDQAKDVITSGGENIATIEVEAALASHPDVLEVAVVAVPDEQWGEHPKGFVTLRAGATLSGAELIAFSRETLPGLKAPTEIEFGRPPKASTGNVKKYQLRERVRAELQRKRA